MVGLKCVECEVSRLLENRFYGFDVVKVSFRCRGRQSLNRFSSKAGLTGKQLS